MTTVTTATIQTATNVAESLMDKGATAEGASYAAAKGLIDKMAAERPDLLARLFAEVAGK